MTPRDRLERALAAAKYDENGYAKVDVEALAWALENLPASDPGPDPDTEIRP